MGSPISTVKVDIADFFVEVMDLPDDTTRGEWLRRFARSLAKKDGAHPYAVKLLAEAEEYRTADAQRKATEREKKRLELSKDKQDIQGQPGTSKDGAGILPHTFIHSDIHTSTHSLSSLLADFFRVFPRERERRGVVTKVQWGEKATATLARLMLDRPEFPWTKAAEHERAKKGAARNLSTFVEDLPTLEELRPLMAAPAPVDESWKNATEPTERERAEISEMIAETIRKLGGTP